MTQEPAEARSARPVLPRAARMVMIHMDALPSLERLAAHRASVVLRCQNQVELFLGDVEEFDADQLDARIRHGDVDLPEAPCGLGEEALDVGQDGHVRLHRDRLRAEALDLCDRGIGFLFAGGIVHHDVRAEARLAQCNRLAVASGRA